MSVKKRRVRLLVYLGVLVCLSVPQAVSIASPLRIVTFNILAACWASPRLYPNISAPILDRLIRRQRTLEFLHGLDPDVDIISLQETTGPEFDFFSEHLKDDFLGFQVFHAPSYWADWVTADPAWEPNGVAIFVRKKSFRQVVFHDLPLTQSGNHAAYVQAIHLSSGKTLRAVALHLDAINQHTRNAELSALLEHLPAAANTVDVMAGDFNTDTQSGYIQHLLREHNFHDVLADLGRDEWTSPYYEGGTQSREDGILDHLVVRGALAQDGYVAHGGLWQEFPSDETARIDATLRRTGSDHFAVIGAVEVSAVP